jgi:membrane-bound lytic murein transglycosylase A
MSLSERQALLQSMRHSLRYLRTGRAKAEYARFSRVYPEVTRERVIAGLERMRQFVNAVSSASVFEAKIADEFERWTPPALPVPQGVAQSDTGNTLFTGYFAPVYRASLTPNATFRYPVYRLPALSTWPHPHPTRRELEGADGLARSPLLRGREIAYLPSRLEAFLIQVEGSARLQLTDGRIIALGYGGRTDHPYTSVGQELVRNGKIAKEELTGQTLRAYFAARPDELSVYLPRNARYVFFTATRPTRSASLPPATGSIGAPLTPQRSVAVDSRVCPPGGLARIVVNIANPQSQAIWQTSQFTRYVLAQDAGGAIQGGRRVDLFTGTGERAGELAGALNAEGRLEFLLLKRR